MPAKGFLFSPLAAFPEQWKRPMNRARFGGNGGLAAAECKNLLPVSGMFHVKHSANELHEAWVAA
jgi:hypothetical protein